MNAKQAWMAGLLSVGMVCGKPGAAGAAAGEMKLELADVAGRVWVNGFGAGPTPVPVKAREGDIVRVAESHCPGVGMVYTFDYVMSKRHISDQEELMASLVFPYAGETELKLRRDPKRVWYRATAGGEMPVAIDTCWPKEGDPVAALSEALAKKPSYLWVKLEASQAAALLPLLKDVPLLGVYVRHADEAALAEVAKFRNVKFLSVQAPFSNHGHEPSTLKSIAPIAGMTWLKMLNLEGSDLLEDISPVAGLTELTNLDLVLCPKVTNLSALSSLKKLRALSLPMQTTDAQLAAVCAEHPGLTHLNLQFCRGLTELKPVAGLADLEGLCLEHCSPGLKDVPCLTGVKKLRILSLAPTKTIDAELGSICAGLPGLESISLSYSAVKDLKPLASMKALTSFSLYCAGAKDRDLSPLAGLTGLVDLDLRECGATNLAALAGLTNLRSLSLQGLKAVTDLSSLAGMKRLEYLVLFSASSVSDLSPIAGITGLKFIYLRGTAVADLSPLSGMKDMVTIYLTEAKNVKDLKPVHGLKKLRNMPTFGCTMSKEEVQAFSKAVPGCSMR